MLERLPKNLLKKELPIDQTPYPHGRTSLFRCTNDDPRSAEATFMNILSVGPLESVKSEMLIERFYGSALHGLFEHNKCITKALVSSIVAGISATDHVCTETKAFHRQ